MHPGGRLLHGDRGKRTLRKLVQSGRAWSPADEAPKPGRGGCQKVLLGMGQSSCRGGDAPMGPDEGSVGQHERREAAWLNLELSCPSPGTSIGGALCSERL